MRLLLDECVPRSLKKDFIGYEISTIEEADFKGLKNGNLLVAATGIYEVLITVDKNIRHQQNKDSLPLAIVILAAASNRYESLSPLMPEIFEVLESIKIGEIKIISEN